MVVLVKELAKSKYLYVLLCNLYGLYHIKTKQYLYIYKYIKI